MFTNHYCHEDCPVQPDIEWEQRWSCACNDKCPACNAEVEPYESVESEAKLYPHQMQAMNRLLRKPTETLTVTVIGATATDSTALAALGSKREILDRLLQGQVASTGLTLEPRKMEHSRER